jgi:hypothetical protein
MNNRMMRPMNNRMMRPMNNRMMRPMNNRMMRPMNNQIKTRGPALKKWKLKSKYDENVI